MTQRSFVSDDGVTLVYGDYGPADGVPVVLCHGLAASAEQFEADAAYFGGLGYRVLVPNLRGHGLSGKPAEITPEAFSIPRLATDLCALLDHADAGPVHWMGNSLGGIVALQMLGNEPQRFRTLATFGTAYALGLPRIGAAVIPLGYAVLGKRLAGLLMAQGTTRDPAARQLIARVLEAFDPRVGQAVAHNVARYDLIGNGVSATLPMLLLHCGRDAAVNRALGPTLKAMSGRPNFTLVEVPEGGHCANLDATDAVRRELLRFWGRN